jgi:hypothetical protein
MAFPDISAAYSLSKVEGEPEPLEGRTSDEVMLVQRAIGHDAEAFGRLYDMHVHTICGH